MAFPFRGLQEPLELREDELDRVQIRAVWRQVDEPRSRSRDPLPNAGNLVSTELVHHHDVAWLKGRDQMAGYASRLTVRLSPTPNAPAEAGLASRTLLYELPPHVPIVENPRKL